MGVDERATRGDESSVNAQDTGRRNKMSREALAKVIQRSISDAAFRRQLATDPSGALRGYELSDDESSAIRSGDSRRLVAMGVEQRMSKAFALSGDASTADSVSHTVASDLNAGVASGTLTGMDSSFSNSTLTGTDAAFNNSTLTGTDAAFNNSALTGTQAAASSSVLSPGDGAAGGNALISGGGAVGGNALISGDASDTDPMIASGNEFGRTGALIGNEPAHALGADTADSDGYLPTINYANTGGEGGHDDVLITGDDAASSGAAQATDATEGPNISQ